MATLNCGFRRSLPINVIVLQKLSSRFTNVRHQGAAVHAIWSCVLCPHDLAVTVCASLVARYLAIVA